MHVDEKEKNVFKKTEAVKLCRRNKGEKKHK